MLNGGSMVWGFCVYFVYMIPLETDVLRKHRFQKIIKSGLFVPIDTVFYWKEETNVQVQINKPFRVKS